MIGMCALREMRGRACEGETGRVPAPCGSIPQAHSSTVTRTKRSKREGSHGLPVVFSSLGRSSTPDNAHRGYPLDWLERRRSALVALRRKNSTRDVRRDNGIAGTDCGFPQSGGRSVCTRRFSGAHSRRSLPGRGWPRESCGGQSRRSRTAGLGGIPPFFMHSLGQQQRVLRPGQEAVSALDCPARRSLRGGRLHTRLPCRTRPGAAR